MTATLPSSYGSNNLIWSRTYLPIFNNGTIGSPNGDLNASGRRTRLVDLGTGTTSCPVTDEFDLSTFVSAYSSTPMANVDFSFVLTQEGWFQVVGGGVNAKNEVSSGVPISVGATSRALTLSGTRADNGLVSFLTYSNINANNTNNAYGLSNNWWINRNTNNPLAYSYQNLYNSFFVNRGMGTTGSDWTGKPSEGIYFVNGNLNIDSNFSLAAGRTFIVIVKGNITIDSGVDRLDGIYIADGGITAGGDSASQLVINGMLYARGNIRLYRSYTDKIINNSSPAVVVNYRPDLIFNMPGSLMRVLSGWREE